MHRPRALAIRGAMGACTATALLLGACGESQSPAIDAARIENPSPGEWLSYGRTYDEQRYTPLARITDQNVAELGLAWSFDLGAPRGAEATPLVADGVLYISEPWSVVQALNAKTGEPIWRFDPQVPREKAYDSCCDVVNRGVALWGDSVFVGALNGRLIALDARNGKVRWTQETFDPATPRLTTSQQPSPDFSRGTCGSYFHSSLPFLASSA